MQWGKVSFGGAEVLWGKVSCGAEVLWGKVHSTHVLLLQEEADPRRKVSFEHDFRTRALSVMQQANDVLLRLNYKETLEVCYPVMRITHAHNTIIHPPRTTSEEQA